MDKNLCKSDIINLLTDNSKANDLFSEANEVRKQFVGDEVHLRALIEFSNLCAQNCNYCGIRHDNKNIKRYKLSVDEIVTLAKKAQTQGYKTVVLQSGEGYFYKIDEIIKIISEIKKLNLALTLSIGEKTFEEYKAFKDAGADRFLLRIETTDKLLYKKMHPNMDFDNRVRCLNDLKALGYEVGTGCLVGLPSQTIESLADDILFFKKIDADMIGIGPFIPCPNTPLHDACGGSFELALKVMAVTRILMPDINIPATTAMETLRKNGRIIALQSGANVFMPNLTDTEHRLDYSIYPNKSTSVPLKDDLAKIGRVVSDGFGFRKK